MEPVRIVDLIRKNLEDGTLLRDTNGNESLIRLPFWDNYGDPIEISVASHESHAIIDDGGAISGLLFSLGQHTPDTPPYRLLRNLEHAHGLELDFNEGLVKLRVSYNDIYRGVVEFVKVILAIQAVTPHIRVAPRRMRSLGGRRLKSRIREEYRSLGIFDFIEPDFQVSGQTIPYWHADFHWSVNNDEEISANVYVVATDLNIAEPLQRAQGITAFSLDAATHHRDDIIRVVLEAPEDNVAATEAARFLRHHSGELPYKVYDYGNASERSEFLDISADEILGDAGIAWRDMVATRRGLESEILEERVRPQNRRLLSLQGP